MRAKSAFQHWCDTKLEKALEKQRVERAAQGLPAPQILIEAPGMRFHHGETTQRFHPTGVGKLFTAALYARLIQRGMLELDTPIGNLKTDIDLHRLPAIDGVDLHTDLTVEHLLSHGSGLPDPIFPPSGYTTECSIEALLSKPDRHWRPADIVDQTRHLPEQEEYWQSEANYALLLHIAEKLTSVPAEPLLQQEVFGPLGMRNTGNDGGAPPAGLWIRGQDLSTRAALSAFSADGATFTTLEDLQRFNNGIHGGFIDPGLLATMTRPQAKNRQFKQLRGLYQGAGLTTLRVNKFSPLLRNSAPLPVGGIGRSATHCFYYPAQHAHIILNYHSDGEITRSFQTHLNIAHALKTLQEKLRA